MGGVFSALSRRRIDEGNEMLRFWRKAPVSLDVTDETAPSAPHDFQPGSLQAHPLADVFPLIDGPAFDAMVLSIIRDGQIEPILLWEGRIIDGRNRYRACISAGVVPRCEHLDGMSPETLGRFVEAKNVTRRHLTEAQRAMAAARLSSLTGMQIIPAALSMSVSRASTVRARAILASGDSNVIRLIDRGALGIKQGHDLIKPHSKPTRAAHEAKMLGLLDAVEKLLPAGNAWPADVRARAASVGAQLVALGVESEAA